MNTKGTKFLAVLAVLAMAFAAFAVVDNGATDGADITYIHGEIIADQEYFSGKIVVDQDLVVKNGATLSIYGDAEFVVPAGVTLTIDGIGETGSVNAGKSAALFVNQVNEKTNNAFITVDGSIVVGENGIFLFKATNADADTTTLAVYDPIESIVNGSVNVNRGGVAYFEAVVGSGVTGNQAITFADGSALNVTSSGAYTSIVGGFIQMEAGSIANIVANIGSVSDGNYVNGWLHINAFDVQMKDTYVDVIPALLGIGGTSAKATSSTDVSKFTISVGSNIYNAWRDTDMSPSVSMQKFKIVEDVININMNVKNGEVLDIAGSYSDPDFTYFDKKADGVAIEPASAVIFQGENKISDGMLFLQAGEFYLAEDSTFSFKYVENKANAPKFGTGATATVYVSGSVDLYTVNIREDQVSTSGKIVIDGGVITLTDKGVTATPGFPFSVCPAAAGLKGAYFLNDDKDVMTICEIEAAFAAAALDSDIEMINVCGFNYNSSTDDDAYIIKTDLTVWAGLTLGFGGYVIIDDGVTLTLEKDGTAGLASFPGAIGVVDIDGAVLDYNCSLKAIDNPTFNYSVIISDEDETYEMYMSFANAMDVVKAGDEIEIVKKAVIDTTVTIPEGVTVTIAKPKAPSTEKIVVEIIKDKANDQDGKLINNGIFDTTEGKVNLSTEPTTVSGHVGIIETADYDKFFVNENVTVVLKDGDNFTVDGEDFTVPPSVFYAEGKIFDEKANTFYFLSASAVEKYSALLKQVDVEGEIVIGTLTLVAGDLFNDELIFHVDNGAELVATEIILDNNCKFQVDNDNDAPDYPAKFTGAVTYNTTAGKSTVVFDEATNFDIAVEEEDEDDDVVITTMQISVHKTGTTLSFDEDLAITSGLVMFIDDVTFKNVMYVADGATLVMKDGKNITSTSKDGEYDLVVDGILVFDGDSTVTDMYILLNGDMEIYGGVTFTTGIISVFGSIMISEDEDDDASLALNGTQMYLGLDAIDSNAGFKYKEESADAINAISGKITLANDKDTTTTPEITSWGLLYNYGYDLTGATILSGGVDAKYTDFMVDGALFATVYAATGTEVAVDLFVLPVDVPGYELDWEAVQTGTTGNGPFATPVYAYNAWYTDADMTKYAYAKKVGDVDVVFGALESKWVTVMISTEPGITLYVDGLKVENSDSYQIGTYAVKAVVEPGYQSDVKIMFDGQEIKDGKLVITADLVEDYNDGGDAPKLIATGEVTPIPEPVKGMSITEILLIVLVILIAIMAVIVALRLNRS